MGISFEIFLDPHKDWWRVLLGSASEHNPKRLAVNAHEYKPACAQDKRY